MKSPFNAKTLWCLIVGFALQVAPIIYAAQMAGHPVSEFAKVAAVIVRLVGTASFMAGVGFLAQNKGRTGFLGALGILSLLGLGIVMALPSVKNDRDDEKT